MVTKFRNEEGNLEVDPLNVKRDHEHWVDSITNLDGTIRFYTFKTISADASVYLTKHILDLEHGRNLSKGVSKGKRSYAYMNSQRQRLKKIFEMLEQCSNKTLFEFTEEDVFTLFRKMRDGEILTYRGTKYTAVANYSKVFYTFWRWLMRVRKREGHDLADIVADLDKTKDEKPKWYYFNLKDVEKMAEYAPNYYYRVLAYFLFDSGIRAPKELMNVRAMDLSPVPNSNHLLLEIRNDTSKTYGRKIKLMICSDIVKKYIQTNNLRGEDFLFTKSYTVTCRVMARMAFRAIGKGKESRQKTGKILVIQGVTMYDFRHNSVCHYLPIYKSENSMKYRYGWSNASMIQYYSEFMGMHDVVTDEDMVVDSNKVGLQMELEKEKQRVAVLQEQLDAQRKETEERFKKMEAMMLQRFAQKM